MTSLNLLIQSKNLNDFLQQKLVSKCSFIPTVKAEIHEINDDAKFLFSLEVLDACSAPGNKTVHVAALMKGKGKILACELNKERVKRLEDTIRLSGASSILPMTFCSLYASTLVFLFLIHYGSGCYLLFFHNVK